MRSLKNRVLSDEKKTSDFAKPRLCDVLSLDDLDGEIWHDMFGFDGLYSVSNFGRVKREFRYDEMGRKLVEKILSRQYWKTKKGNITGAKVTWGCGGKMYSKAVSILVAEAFLGEIPENHCVVHLDKDVCNDLLINLKIMTYSDSLKLDYEKQNKTDWGFGIIGNVGKNKPVEQIDDSGNVVAEFESLRDVVKKLGHCKTVISDFCRNRYKDKPHYRAYGFRWRFKHIT